MIRTHFSSSAAMIRRLLLAWLTAVAVESLRLPPSQRTLSDTTATALLSPARIAVITAVLTVLLCGLSRFCRTQTAERWGIVGMLALSTAVFLAANPSSPAFWGICLLLIAAALPYAVRGHRNDSPAPSVSEERCGFRPLTAGLAVAFFLLVSIWTVSRVLSLRTPTYDFGIFSQMFHYMKTTGEPLTTLERDGLLSHFHVHMSPIYYLLLPIYMLIPHPATLQVCQAAILASAVIPLWKIGRDHGLNAPLRTLLCAALLLYPALAGGTSYDIHENCFLTPLILWLFLGIDRKSIPLTAVSALLLLAVKEDAAVYVALIGLWLIVRSLVCGKRIDRRDLITGGLLFAVSLACFLLVTAYLRQIGDGVMTGRYQNFMYEGGDTLLTVVRTALVNPMKILYECVDREKLEYIALTLLPLLGLPLLTRRYERLLLLIPYILVNLMPDYVYQHSIYFQYSFGSLACLFYLAAVNLADMKLHVRTVALCTAVAASVFFFSSTMLPKATDYTREYIQNRAHYRAISEVLATIPDDTSVTATTFYTTPLSDRDQLYDLLYTSREQVLQSDFVVLDPGLTDDFSRYAPGNGKNGYANLVALLHRHGYHEYARVGQALIIFQRDP